MCCLTPSKRLFLTYRLFQCKIFSNIKYFTFKYFIVEHLQVFGYCCELNIANINQSPLATIYPATTNHCKNTPTVIPSNQPLSSTYPKTQESPKSPPTIQKKAIKTTTKDSKNHHQLLKKQPLTTQKTTTNNPKIHIRKVKTLINHIKNLKRKPTNKKSKLKIQQPSKSSGGKIRTATCKIQAAAKNPSRGSAAKSQWIL